MLIIIVSVSRFCFFGAVGVVTRGGGDSTGVWASDTSETGDGCPGGIMSVVATESGVITATGPTVGIPFCILTSSGKGVIIEGGSSKGEGVTGLGLAYVWYPGKYGWVGNTSWVEALAGSLG